MAYETTHNFCKSDCPSPSPTQLFVIQKAGRPLFWHCSTEHGCGWHEGHPKQSFSKSELSREIVRMIERGYFTAIEIHELVIR